MNLPGVWQTSDVSARATALFIAAGMGAALRGLGSVVFDPPPLSGVGRSRLAQIPGCRAVTWGWQQPRPRPDLNPVIELPRYAGLPRRWRSNQSPVRPFGPEGRCYRCRFRGVEWRTSKQPGTVGCPCVDSCAQPR